VAFFTDSYVEVNGVARTSKQFEAFARKTGRPFLCVHGTDSGAEFAPERDLRLALQRGRASFRVERDLKFDLNLWRHARTVLDAVSNFGANVVHVTSPGDVGLLGAYVAHKLGIALVASWHTNVHEYANSRLYRLLPFLPDAWRDSACKSAQIHA